MRRVHIENQANSHPETRQAMDCVTRRVHMRNQDNSPPKIRQAKVYVTKECTEKTRQAHPLKKDRPQSMSH